MLAHTSLCEMAFRTGVLQGMDAGCSWQTVWEGEEHEQDELCLTNLIDFCNEMTGSMDEGMLFILPLERSLAWSPMVSLEPNW